jgi:nucleotide-binding universal stress UspA family protein
MVRIGRSAEEIVSAADRADLVLLATHGRSGIARWWLGSVADVVVRDAPCPVLIIGPNVSQELPNLARVLLPLDGSLEAERALPVAAWIADATQSELDIVRCVTLTPIAYDPSLSIYSADVIGSLEEAANEYLAGVQQRLGSRKVTASMYLGSASEMLMQHLENRPAGLVVMTSHGRSGVRRVALGSVTDRLLHGPSPVLVIRAAEDAVSDLVERAKAAFT